MMTFGATEKKDFSKYCGKRMKCRKKAFSPFSTTFSTLEIQIQCFEKYLKSSSADGLNSNILTHYHTMLYFDSLKVYNCGNYCEKGINCL